MVEAPAEVPESQAEGKVKSTYDDVKETLRLPYVPDVIRAIAVYPRYLQLAWMALKPNAQTVYFERQSDLVRRTAADLTARFPRAHIDDASLTASFRTLWYAAPKELLATAALRSATSGQQPRLRTLGPDDTRQIAPGVPDGATPPPRGTAAADDESRAILQEMAAPAGSILPVEYAVLASSPAALAPASKALRALTQDLEYRRIQRTIGTAVEEAVTALPFRMDISGHVLRHGGLSESEIDAIRELLTHFDRAARQTLLNVAILSGLGPESPFPISS